MGFKTAASENKARRSVLFSRRSMQLDDQEGTELVPQAAETDVQDLKESNVFFRMFTDNDDKRNRMAKNWRVTQAEWGAVNPLYQAKILKDDAQLEEKEEDKKTKKFSLRKAWKLFEAELLLIIIGTLLSGGGTAMSLLLPQYNKDFINAIQCSEKFNHLAKLPFFQTPNGHDDFIKLFENKETCIHQLLLDQGGLNCCGMSLSDGSGVHEVDKFYYILVYITAAQIAGSTIANLVFGIVARRVISRTRQRLMASLLRQDMSFFERRGAGELMSRLSTDVNMLTSLTTIVAQCIHIVSTLGLSIVFAFRISYSLSILFFLGVPPLFLSSIFMARFIRKWTQIILKNLATQNQVAQENLTAVKTIRIFNGFDAALLRYTNMIQRLYRQQLTVAYASAVYGLCNTIVQSGVWLLILYLASTMILQKKLVYPFKQELTIGALFAFQSYTTQLRGAVSGLSGIYAQIIRCLTVAEVLSTLIFRKPRGGAESTIGAGEKPANVLGEIEFHNVSFVYSTRLKAKILKGLSVKFPANCMTCVIGPSGSGKSTLFALALRLYEPLAGYITLDGRELPSYNLAWLRNQIAYVTQEPVLFTCTIKENLKYGNKDASQSQIEQALADSGASEFVDGLSDGIETKVQDGSGSSFSVGQKQRLAIARAFLRPAPILLMDEPTSALDVKSEELVTLAIEKLVRNRTSIMITHRLNTLNAASNIVCVRGGAVVEHGKPSDLMAKKGMFHDFMQKNGHLVKK